MHDREWERIYKDAVEDAMAMGASHKNASVNDSRVRILQGKIKKMYGLLKTVWQDGYEARMSDEHHGTKTKFEETDWRERCTK